MNRGIFSYEKIKVEIDEVGSYLSLSGYYTAGIAGVYQVSASGYAGIYPGQEAIISLQGTGDATHEGHFIDARVQNKVHGWVHDSSAGIRHVKLRKGQRIYLENTATGRFDHMTFCVSLV